MASANIECTRIKLGNNLDPSKNFYISVPDNADGTLNITRASDGRVAALIGADNKVTFPGNTQAIQSPVRAAATDYTNDTSQTITVMVMVTSGVANGIIATVDGELIYGNSSTVAGVWLSITFTVPPGKVYRVAVSTGIATIGSWKELR